MRGRVVALDYVRGAAAASVAIPHFFVYHSICSETFEAASALGVEVFFVLSGYVLAGQLFHVIEERRARTLGIFLVRRWMRTVPPYAVALCIISLMVGRFGSADFYHYLFYVQNLWRQSNSQDYFAVAWSLSVEEWFYLVFPLVLLLAAAVCQDRNARTTAFVAAGVFVVLVNLLRIYFGDVEHWGSAVRRVVLFRIDSIAFGFLLHALLRNGHSFVAHKFCRPVVTALFVVFGGLSFWLMLRAMVGSDFAKQLFPFAATLFGASAIVIALTFEQRLSLAPRLSAIGVASGKVSYSIYLFHTIILSLMGAALASEWLPLQLALYVVLVTALAGAFYQSFERPILAMRPSYRQVGLQFSAAAAVNIDPGKV